MGNRAVISIKGATDPTMCVYVHWNGGRASIKGFLRAAKAMDIGASHKELHHLIQGYLGSSAYLEPIKNADKDNGDNGQYFVSPADWSIKSQWYRATATEIDEEKTQDIAEVCVTMYIWGENARTLSETIPMGCRF